MMVYCHVHFIPPTGSASPDLLLTSFVSKVFDLVGVDPPIRVSFTSGAGVIVVFSDIAGANFVVIFELLNTIVSDGIPTCAYTG